MPKSYLEALSDLGTAATPWQPQIAKTGMPHDAGMLLVLKFTTVQLQKPHHLPGRTGEIQ